jgi:hypothetical protein
MKQAEFNQFAEAGALGQVTLHRVLDEGWEVWAYDVEGARTVGQFGNRLTGVKGEPRMYTSLDRARDAIRKAGYSGIIEIDG